jgi:hypothetical protein
MHLFKGLIESTVALTFRMSNSNKISKSKQRRIPVAWLNNVLCDVRLPSDLSRRTREIDRGYTRTEELRNWGVILFPLFADAIGEHRPEYEIWLLLAILMRVYYIPSNTGSLALPREQCMEAHERFHKAYGGLFGRHNLVYNPHVFTHFYDCVRSRGHITESSAYAFESSYAPYIKS